jgi:hypothetical protein
MPNIKAALERLRVKSEVINGEVIMTDEDGSDHAESQKRGRGLRPPRGPESGAVSDG